MNTTRSNKTHVLLAAVRVYIEWVIPFNIHPPPSPPPSPVDDICSIGEQKHGIFERCRTEY